MDPRYGGEVVVDKITFIPFTFNIVKVMLIRCRKKFPYKIKIKFMYFN